MGAQQKAKAKAKTEAEAPRSESPSPSGKRRAPAAAGDRGAGRQKKRKKAHSTRDVAAAQGAAGPASAGALHPFEHDPADDCETCFQAYQVCMRLGQRPDTRYMNCRMRDRRTRGCVCPPDTQEEACACRTQEIQKKTFRMLT